MGSAIASFIYPVPPLCQMENMPDWSTVPTAELLAVMSTILVVLSGRLGSMAGPPPLNEVLSPTEVFSEVPVVDPPVEDGSVVEFRLPKMDQWCLLLPLQLSKMNHWSKHLPSKHLSIHHQVAGFHLQIFAGFHL